LKPQCRLLANKSFAESAKDLARLLSRVGEPAPAEHFPVRMRTPAHRARAAGTLRRRVATEGRAGLYPGASRLTVGSRY